MLRERTHSAKLAAIGWAELLFLMRYENPLPIVYWNYAAYGYYGDVQNESFGNAAARVLLSVDPDAFIWTTKIPLPSFLHRDFEMTLLGREDGSYRVPLATRRPARS